MADRPELRAPDPSNGRRELAWLGAILVLALAIRLIGFSEPWYGRGFKSAFGTVTTGAHARGFYEHGFLESGLMPFDWRLELADGTVEHSLYAHHPVLVAILPALSMRAFGPEEWAVRLPFLLLSLASVAFVWRLARALSGAAVARLAALFMALLPLSAWYGTLAWIDGGSIVCISALAWRYLRWMRSDRTAELGWAALWAFAGGLCDWSAHLFLPGLALHALWVAYQRRSLARVLPVLLVPLGAGLSIALHKFHMHAVLPAELIEADARATGGWVRKLMVPLPEFLANQLSFAERYLTVPGILLVVAGAGLVALRAARAARATRSADELLALPLLLPGPLYVALTPARSVNHDMFLFVSLPGFALAAAIAWDAVARPLGRHAPRAAWLAPAALLSLGVLFAARVVELWSRQRSDAVARLVRVDWLAPLLADPQVVVVASTGQSLSLPFYSRAPIVRDTDSPARLEELRARWLSRLGPEKRVVFLFDLLGAETFAELRARLGQIDEPELHAELAGESPPLAFELYDLTAWVRSGKEEGP